MIKTKHSLNRPIDVNKILIYQYYFQNTSASEECVQSLTFQKTVFQTPTNARLEMAAVTITAPTLMAATNVPAELATDWAPTERAVSVGFQKYKGTFPFILIMKNMSLILKKIKVVNQDFPILSLNILFPCFSTFFAQQTDLAS